MELTDLCTKEALDPTQPCASEGANPTQPCATSRAGQATQPRARIIAVAEGSPADDAGFTPGCFLTSVDGHPLRDSIDWMWHSGDLEMEVGYIDEDGDSGTVELVRDEGEDWGFTFDGAIYDKIKLCRNACVFCFMRQLPEEARETLVLRDDDYRLSFLQGTFVTLTNVRPEDEARIVEQHISPLRFSLHCITPEVRREVIGRHAAHGIEVCERLLAAGIELHAQIVLMPGINDGAELARTLEWAYAHEGILTLGIVPVGFTKHQDYFKESFNDVAAARAVIDAIVPYQRRALAERGTPWVFAADEFYRNAFPDSLLENLPPTDFYGDFDMFEDGIGIVRSFVDDWEASQESLAKATGALRAAGKRVHFVAGCAQREFFAPLIERAGASDVIVPLFVHNDYFGGNVDVTGLLCGCDIAAALRAEDAALREGSAGAAPSDGPHAESAGAKDAACARGIDFAVIPKVVFNADGVTLDDMTLQDIVRESRVRTHVVSCNASDFLSEIIAYI